MIQENPGITSEEGCKIVGIHYKTFQIHTRKLEEQGKITIKRAGTYSEKHFFTV